MTVSSTNTVPVGNRARKYNLENLFFRNRRPARRAIAILKSRFWSSTGCARTGSKLRKAHRKYCSSNVGDSEIQSLKRGLFIPSEFGLFSVFLRSSLFLHWKNMWGLLFKIKCWRLWRLWSSPRFTRWIPVLHATVFDGATLCEC